jgi:D-hexose-6-phosphate mutarotase
MKMRNNVDKAYLLEEYSQWNPHEHIDDTPSRRGRYQKPDHRYVVAWEEWKDHLRRFHELTDEELTWVMCKAEMLMTTHKTLLPLWYRARMWLPMEIRVALEVEWWGKKESPLWEESFVNYTKN